MPTDATAPPAHTAALRFGPQLRFELQPAERRLLVDGEPAALGQRALDLLIVLAERPDHLLHKHELLDRVWPGLVVEEANLQMQVSNLRKLLGGDLIATVPGRGYRFTAATHGAPATSAAAPLPKVPSPPRAVPAHRLIGRDADLALLEGLLQAGGGAITLAGTAGVGKTSLARAAAARWPGRSVWVDLAALGKGSQVAGALARALDLQLVGGEAEAPAQLVAALQGQALLLVLDNAEHLVDTCAGLASLLRPLAGVQLLATSQSPLGVAGERLLRLAPLALPAAPGAPGGTAGTDASCSTDSSDSSDSSVPHGALALLLDRISAADHRFAATPAQQPLLRAICAQLDGLPLALEMAAARVPLLGLQGVHDALAQRFALLTRGHRDASQRHRTLHNALDWSYRLLAPAEQQLFRALGVFADGFTLDLAVALAGGDTQARWDVIDGLAALADRSLLVVHSSGTPRYSLLETMRAFALEQLQQSAAPHDAAAVCRRHAAAVLALFQRHEQGNTASTALCLREMENARDAIAWAREHDLGTAALLTAQVVQITTFTVWRHESGNWLLALEPCMEQPAGLALPPAVQAAWWTQRTRIAAIRRDAQAPVAARRAVALWRPLGQPHELLRATISWVRSFVASSPELELARCELQAQAAALPSLSLRERLGVQGALVRAASLFGQDEAVLAGHLAEIELARAAGDNDILDAAETGVVITLVRLDRCAEAAERGRLLLDRMDADGSGSSGNLPYVFSGLIDALLVLGRLADARALLPRALAAGRRFATPAVLPLLSVLAGAERRFEAAAQLIGYASQRYAAVGSAYDLVEEASARRGLARAAEALGAAEADALLQQGRALDDAAAEALALAGRLQLLRRQA